jgi:hypothetical protein
MFANWEVTFSFRIHGVRPSLLFTCACACVCGGASVELRVMIVVTVAIAAVTQVSTYGADGLAFWYTEKIDKAGSLFGNDEFFKGIGIVVDTYVSLLLRPIRAVSIFLH